MAEERGYAQEILIGMKMLSPEELEIQSLYLNMHDNPEISKALYGYVADYINGLVNELIDNGALEAQPEDIINALIQHRDELLQISAL